MRQPSNNDVSLKYGAITPSPPYSSSNKHAGTDYRYSSDPNGYVVEKSKVTRVGNLGACGYSVDYTSLDGHRAYRHCHAADQQIYAKAGQIIDEGYLLHKMGATGAAIGAHLHLAMWVDGVRVDPYATIELMKGENVSTPATKQYINSIYGAYQDRTPSPEEVKSWEGRPIELLLNAIMADPFTTQVYAKRQAGKACLVSDGNVLSPGKYIVK